MFSLVLVKNYYHPVKTTTKNHFLCSFFKQLTLKASQINNAKGIRMIANSFFDIPSLVDNKNLPFILKRLDNEQFSRVGCLSPNCIEKFREILRDFFNRKITLEEAVIRAGKEITPPITYKRVSRWQERAVRSEISKIFTLGFGDYLLSIGETECCIPHTKFDESLECKRVISGQKFPIKTIQDNIYENYGLRFPSHPTVPLHANCRHIITKI